MGGGAAATAGLCWPIDPGLLVLGEGTGLCAPGGIGGLMAA